MIPGPVDVSDEVLAALAAPILPHYGDDWVETHTQAIAELKAVFQTEADAYLLPGSGSSGLEAAIGSVLRPSERAVVMKNGAFGDRLISIAEARGIDLIVHETEWGKPVDPGEAKRLLGAHQPVAGLITIHNETSTGVVNPIRKIASECRARGVPLIVDGVSSIGGIEMQFDAWDIDVCATASQKALGCAPGLSPVAVGKNAWEVMDAKGPAPSWYLSLQFWRDEAVRRADWHPHPVTMPVNLVLALRVSMQQILAEGLAQRFERHARVAKRLRDGLRGIGFSVLADESAASGTVTTALTPDGVSGPDLQRRLLEKHNIMVAFAHDPIKQNAIRIGHMGVNASEEKVDLVLDVLRGCS